MNDRQVTFNLNSVFGAIHSIFEFFGSMFRPVANFMREVAGASWLGFAVIFMIFFTLFLIRMGARSAKGIAVYGVSLEYIGLRGLVACGAFLAILALEWAVMPVLTVLVDAAENSFSDGTPGLFQLAGFLATPSPSRTAFLHDIATFYREGHSALPLGFKATGLIAVAFGSMLMVGRAAAKLTVPAAAPPAA